MQLVCTRVLHPASLFEHAFISLTQEEETLDDRRGAKLVKLGANGLGFVPYLLPLPSRV